MFFWGATVAINTVMPALAQDKSVKIGVLTDESGIFADSTGLGSILSAQMAIEDSGLVQKGWTIELVSADHQNKADVGSAIARGWFDKDKVDTIVDVPNSAVGLAVNNVVRDKNGVYINSGAATSDLTNAQFRHLAGRLLAVPNTRRTPPIFLPPYYRRSRQKRR